MDARERTILESLRFDAAPTEKTLWGGQLPHVPELNQPVYDTVRREITALRGDRVDSPPGLVVHGEFGSGKSHLVWWARRFIAGIGGYYFNIQPDGTPETLWTRVVSSIVRDLYEPLEIRDDSLPATTQLTLAVTRLATNLGLSPRAVEILGGDEKAEPQETRAHLADLTDRLRSRHPSPGLRNVALALALMSVRDDDANVAGWAYLHDSDDELDSRHNWGLRPVCPSQPDDLVRHLSNLVAMSGPSLFVVDQIDGLVVRSAQSTEHSISDEGATDLAAALMTIREKLTRSITLISCLDHTWRAIQSQAARSALDRFPTALNLGPIPSPAIGRALIAKFLRPQFEELGFAPPYETWPVAREAFDAVTGFRPRQLIQSVGAQVRRHIDADEPAPVRQLEPPGPESEISEEPTPAGADDDRVNNRYLDHRRSVILDGLKETAAEKELAEVLLAATRALASETGIGDEFRVRDTCRGADIPSTHCEATTGDGTKIYLRGVNTFKASAVGSRLDKARAVAYSDPEVRSHLLIARTNPWKPTARVQSATADLDASGGSIIDISDDDLRTLRAVQLTTTADNEETREWLRRHRPVSGTQLGKKVLALLDPPMSPGSENPPANPTHDTHVTAPQTDLAPPVFSRESIPLGIGHENQPLTIDLYALRKHVAMFASSGSGKTVLLRRIIEECALHGVSTIVLDPNNDLARLGDAWPSNPDGWWSGDDERALDYLKNTDVVVWTPGVTRGNPLTLQPFPDFTAVRDDPDELRLAVDTAVASLAPRARIDAENHQADGRRAVLRETLMVFARRGGGSLDQLIELLQEPGDEVLGLPSASKHADYVATALAYARSNDPLFDGEGTPFDPDRLLTPADGYRARVSVINLAGIPDENRPAFVNRLQMALFTWIKRHPARDKPLSGLFIMDEAQTFIPSGRNTPCTESTRNLASQARKYGLGLVYATQAPRGIDNRITGNAASHVYGRVVVPAHVGAVNEMVRARGDQAPPISQLTAGRFYISLEGHALTETTVPMCLSHHGPPLEEAEIAERARSKRP